jgi:hypothetical protein
VSDDSHVDAHDQGETHRYLVHFPEHPARKNDPHYVDFNHFHRKNGPTARCLFAVHADLDDDPTPARQPGKPHRLIGAGEARAGCDTTSPIELHHSHVEFSLQNGVDLALLEKDYPGISNPAEIGEWVESAANLVWLCVFHHRGPGGAHTASASDWEAERYVRNLIQGEPSS